MPVNVQIHLIERRNERVLVYGTANGLRWKAVIDRQSPRAHMLGTGKTPSGIVELRVSAEPAATGAAKISAYRWRRGLELAASANPNVADIVAAIVADLVEVAERTQSD